MRIAKVLYKNQEAGTLSQLDDGSFRFCYASTWLADATKPSISLTLPKRSECYESTHLFAFFFNMLPEGANRDVVCRSNKIDKDDFFGILLHTAQFDTIGAIRILTVA